MPGMTALVHQRIGSVVGSRNRYQVRRLPVILAKMRAETALTVMNRGT
jgi:hypothetical protein